MNLNNAFPQLHQTLSTPFHVQGIYKTVVFPQAMCKFSTISTTSISWQWLALGINHRIKPCQITNQMHDRYKMSISLYLDGVGADTSMSRSPSTTPDPFRRAVFGISFPLNNSCCWPRDIWVWGNATMSMSFCKISKSKAKAKDCKNPVGCSLVQHKKLYLGRTLLWSRPCQISSRNYLSTFKVLNQTSLCGRGAIYSAHCEPFKSLWTR